MTLAVQNGGTTAIIGPNGAGKTTLFNCITGFTRTEGAVLYENRDISSLRPFERARLGFARTFQTPTLIGELTVLDNVLVGAYAPRPWSLVSSEKIRKSDAEWCRELVDRFGLSSIAGERADVSPHAVRRRIELARAFASWPKLLLLDEPAAGLGKDEALEIGQLCAEVAAECGGTILLVEHAVDLVMQLAHTILVLDAGRLIACGSPDAVQANPAVIAAYLGTEAVRG